LNNLVIARNKYIWQMEDAAKSQQKFNKTISDAKAIGIKIDSNSFIMTDELAGKFNSLTASIKRLDQQAQETDNTDVRVNLKITAESLKQYGQALADKNASADKSIRESIKGYSEELGFQLPKAFENLPKTDLEGPLAAVRDTKFKATIGKVALPEIPEKPGLMSQLEGTAQYKKLQDEYNNILQIRKDIEEAGNTTSLDLEITKYSELQKLMEKAKTNPLTAKLLTDEALLSNSINRVTSEYAGYTKEKIDSIGIELADINLQKQIYKDNGEKLAELNSRAENLVSSIKSVDLVPLKESFGVFISEISDKEIQLISPEQAEILRQSALHIANLKEQLTALAKTPNSADKQREIYQQIVAEEDRGRKVAVESSLARKGTLTSGRLSAAADLMNRKYVNQDSLMTLFGMNAAIESLKEKISSTKDPELFVQWKNELNSAEKNLERFKSTFDDITSKTSNVRDIFKTDITDRDLAKLPNGIVRGLIGAAQKFKIELEDALSQSGDEFSDKAKNLFGKLKEIERAGTFITFFKDLANSVEESFTDGIDASLAKIKAGLPELNISAYRLSAMSDQGKGLASEASNLSMLNRIAGMSGLSDAQKEILNRFDKTNSAEILKKLTDDFLSKGSDLNKMLQTPLENSIDATKTLTTSLDNLGIKVDELAGSMATKSLEVPAKETPSVLSPYMPEAKPSTGPRTSSWLDSAMDKIHSTIKSPAAKPVFEANVEKWSDLINDAIKEFPGVTAEMVKTVVQHESQGYNIPAKVKPGVIDTSFGLGQINNATAKFLGVDKTNEADSLRGIAKYLYLNLQMFKNIPDAFRAYAAGQTGAKLGRGYDKQEEFMAIYEGRAGIKAGKAVAMEGRKPTEPSEQKVSNVSLSKFQATSAQAAQEATIKYTSEKARFDEIRNKFGENIRGALVDFGVVDKELANKLGEESVQFLLGITEDINTKTDMINAAASKGQPVEGFLSSLNQLTTLRTSYNEGLNANQPSNRMLNFVAFEKGAGKNVDAVLDKFSGLGKDIVSSMNPAEKATLRAMSIYRESLQDKLDSEKKSGLSTVDTAKKITDLDEKMKEMGDSVTEAANAAKEAGKTFADSFTSTFKDAFKGLLNQQKDEDKSVLGTFGSKLMTGIKDQVVDMFTNSFTNTIGLGKNGPLSRAFNNAGKGISSMFSGIGSGIKDIFTGNMTWDKFSGGISGWWDDLTKKDISNMSPEEIQMSASKIFADAVNKFAGLSGGAGGSGGGSNLPSSLPNIKADTGNFFTNMFEPGGIFGDDLQSGTPGADNFVGPIQPGSQGGSDFVGPLQGTTTGADSFGFGIEEWFKNLDFGFAATGGKISGPGTGTSDSIPTMLSNGEFIINAKDTKENIALLEAINSGKVLRRSAGGIISGLAGVAGAAGNLAGAGGNSTLGGAIGIAGALGNFLNLLNGNPSDKLLQAAIHLEAAATALETAVSAGGLGGAVDKMAGVFDAKTANSLGVSNGIDANGNNINYAPGTIPEGMTNLSRQTGMDSAQTFALPDSGGGPTDITPLIGSGTMNGSPAPLAGMIGEPGSGGGIFDFFKNLDFSKMFGAFGFATGGQVTGAGTATSDSIPAMLSNGEFVVNAAATRKNLPMLMGINNGEVEHHFLGALAGVMSIASSGMSIGQQAASMADGGGGGGGGGIMDMIMKLLGPIFKMIGPLAKIFPAIGNLFGGGGGFDGIGNIFGGGSGGGGGALSADSLGFSSLSMATGGTVTGPGTSTSDSIPAMLSTGEFVVRASAASQHRNLLHQINNGQIPTFATGGLVNASSSVMATPTTRSAKPVVSMSTGKGKTQQVINLNITGDISRQTKSEIYKMMPSIADGVNSQNRETGYKR
jgi:hypothetical protein